MNEEKPKVAPVPEALRRHVPASAWEREEEEEARRRRARRELANWLRRKNP